MTLWTHSSQVYFPVDESGYEKTQVQIGSGRRRTGVYVLWRPCSLFAFFVLVPTISQRPHVFDGRATCRDRGRNPEIWHCSRLSWTSNLSTRFKCL